MLTIFFFYIICWLKFIIFIYNCKNMTTNKSHINVNEPFLKSKLGHDSIQNTIYKCGYPLTKMKKETNGGLNLQNLLKYKVYFWNSTVLSPIYVGLFSRGSPSFILNKVYSFDPSLFKFDDAFNASFLGFIDFLIYQVPQVWFFFLSSPFQWFTIWISFNLCFSSSSWFDF